MSDEFTERLVALVPRLRRYALVASKSGALADDLVQSACEKAWKKRHQFKDWASFDAWVFRILRNTWIDHARSTARLGEVVDISGIQEQLAGGGAETQESTTELNQTLRAIRDLPEEQRDVLVLVGLMEMSYREASEILGVPIGTVMSRLSRGRERLIDRLGIRSDDGRQSGRKTV